MKDIYKILSGKVFVEMNGSIITVGPFSFDGLYLAELFAEKTYQEELEAGSLTEEEAIDIVAQNGWWTPEDEQSLEKIPTIIDNMKLDYFNQFHSVSSRDYIAANIDFQRKNLLSLIEKKHELIGFTCEYARNSAKINFLVEHYSYHNNNQLDFNQISLSKLVKKYNKEILDDTQIRQIAKSNEFRFLWGAYHEEIIRGEISEMKTSLINWSRVYDSVYESSDAPPDGVIKDDLALDGWFIFRRKKREEERKQNAKESTLSDRMSKAGEIFIPYKSKEDIQAIYDLNNTEAKMKLKSLEKDLQRNGTIDDQQLSSNRLEIGMAKNRMEKEALHAKH